MQGLFFIRKFDGQKLGLQKILLPLQLHHMSRVSKNKIQSMLSNSLQVVG